MINYLKQKSIIVLALFLSTSTLLLSQAPYAFNYQGVAYNQKGEPLVDQNISLRISMVKSSTDGDVVFTEEHDVKTNHRGLFAIRIGLGNPILGSLKDIEWNKDHYFIRTEIDESGGTQFTELGTSQLYSVPYALYALKAGDGQTNTPNEVDLQLSYDNDSRQLSIKDGNSVDLSTLVNDDDADPKNELQRLKLQDKTISISDGNSIDLNNLLFEDDDADPKNEIQRLNLQGKKISISDGNSIDLNNLTFEDDDADPKNELQRLNLQNKTISISDGNSIDLNNLIFEDDDADPKNELQRLNLQNKTISISDGNSIDLNNLTFEDDDADPKNELQRLNLQGKKISISKGNIIDLSNLSFDDNDADPKNELQRLSIQNNEISISKGNSITLPIVPRPVLYWNETMPGVISYTGSEARIGGDPNTASVLMGATPNQTGYLGLYNNNTDVAVYLDAAHGITGYGSNDRFKFDLGTIIGQGTGYLDIYAKENKKAASIYALKSGAGNIQTKGPNGNANVWITALAGQPNSGYISIQNDRDEPRVSLWSSASNIGRIATFGSNGQLNINLSSSANYPNHGNLSIRNERGQAKANTYVHPNGYGAFFAEGTNDKPNASITALRDHPNNGYITVYDGRGDNQAGMYVNEQGQGVLFADIKNFRTSHPTQSNQDIVYASLEGPEAAAYLRGTATMVDGIATVDFPEHFQHIISGRGMTVMLTPLSADSKGLAVVKKDKYGIEVRELYQGRGNYSFDWEVKCVRAGYENYKVIRDKASIAVEAEVITNDQDEAAAAKPTRISKPEKR